MLTALVWLGLVGMQERICHVHHAHMTSPSLTSGVSPPLSPCFAKPDATDLLRPVVVRDGRSLVILLGRNVILEFSLDLSKSQHSSFSTIGCLDGEEWRSDILQSTTISYQKPGAFVKYITADMADRSGVSIRTEVAPLPKYFRVLQGSNGSSTNARQRLALASCFYILSTT